MKRVRRQREQIGELADRREPRLAEQLDRPATSELLQIQLDILREPRQIGDGQDLLISVTADKRQDAVVCRSELLIRPAAQGGIAPRRAINRFIHHNSDEGFCCCVSTFTAEYKYSESMITGE